MGITPPIEVANLGMWDSLILMVMALVVFGPRRLPEIGRQIGFIVKTVSILSTLAVGTIPIENRGSDGLFILTVFATFP